VTNWQQVLIMALVGASVATLGIVMAADTRGATRFYSRFIARVYRDSRPNAYYKGNRVMGVLIALMGSVIFVLAILAVLKSRLQ